MTIGNASLVCSQLRDSIRVNTKTDDFGVVLCTLLAVSLSGFKGCEREKEETCRKEFSNYSHCLKLCISVADGCLSMF